MKDKNIDTYKSAEYYEYIIETVGKSETERSLKLIDVFIIADDMTGMLDAAAQFANRGISSNAFLGNITKADLDNCDARVIAVTTESRHLTGQQAYERVYHMTALAREAGVLTILKKTDSVLRGHVGAELAAAMAAADSGRILFFPAYPDQKRTTRDGIQYVEGIPIADSIFKNDKLDPVMSSYIPDILAAETDARIELVLKDTDWEREQPRPAIYVFDSADEKELRAHLAQAKAGQRIGVIAGCAGVAKGLAELIAGSGSVYEERAVNPDKSIFAVCGSFNGVTKRQVEYAAEHGFTYFPIDMNDLLSENNIDTFEFEKAAAEIRAACTRQEPIVLAPVGSSVKTLKPDEALRVSIRIVDRLNSLLMECMELLNDYTLFHTGGDTLSSFIRLSGCKKIAICGELFPGITVNKLFFKGYEKYVISKSGGFGDHDILLRCIGQK